jgi:hypothetical protein
MSDHDIPAALANIVERAAQDAGAAFADDVVAALAELKQRNLAAFVTLRQQPKRADVGSSCSTGRYEMRAASLSRCRLKVKSSAKSWTPPHCSTPRT